MYARKNSFFAVILALVFALASLGAQPLAGKSAAPVVQISVDQAAFSADQAVVVHVTIANPGKSTVKVLKWYTPAEDVEEALFSVTLNGQPVTYQGAVYKRPVPTAADYITLKAGESLTRDVDLSAYYDFSASGTYVIRYAAISPALFTQRTTALKQAEQLASNEVSVEVAGRASLFQAAIVPQAVSGSTTYNKCTTAQQGILVKARAQASTYAADALSYLNSGKQGSRYTTWFGVFDTNRYATVKSHYGSIGNAMNNAAIKFDCGCKKQYYAYVYPTQPYTIYLCSVYWKASLTGTDSQAGTLVHEMSHFNVVASTDDYVYGQSGAKSLAISNPAQAIDNADNHEYFAENNPTLP